MYSDANSDMLKTHAIFKSNIADDIVMEFTIDKKPTTVILSNENNSDLIDLIREFGIDSFEFKEQTMLPCSMEQKLLIGRAFLVAYPLN